MMRKIYNIALTLIAAIAFSSCDDFIEVETRGQQDLDNYFQTETECVNFVNGCYAGFANVEDWWQQWLRLSNQMATDDAWMGNLTQDNSHSYALAHYTVNASNAPDAIVNFYTYKYYDISRCNIAINRIPDAPIAESIKARLVGEAKFLRAYNYWELVQNFGDVVLTLEQTGTAGLTLARSPKEMVYAQIIQDLKDAAAVLPAAYETSELGRATKGACLALLARTYLFTEDYQNAYTYADSVITQFDYQLEPNFVDVWSVYNHNGVESIFEWQSNSDQSFTVGSRFAIIMQARGQVWDDPENSMDGWGWCVPTSDLENAYLSEGDDIRRLSTICRMNEPVYGDEEANPAYNFADNQHKSNRVWRKFYVPIAMRRSLIKEDQHVPLPFIFIRLAEMYLTRAEAAYHLNNPSQALSDINFIRARVNLEPKEGLTGSNLLYAIWKERRLELANEGMRLYDLRRQIDPIANKPRIAVIMGANGTFVRYNTVESTDEWELSHPEERQDKGVMFEEGKHELWPIPQSEIDLSNGVVTQNDGY
nr:RagB/SusD family nutrient uptake outer membrane protein [uncultured Carboxylicivirga sp.]